jgi:hypothetical protein
MALVGKIGEVLATYGFAQVPHAITEACNRALWATERVWRDHIYLSNTLPGTPPDGDRVPERRALPEDDRPFGDDKTPVRHVHGKRPR